MDVTVAVEKPSDHTHIIHEGEIIMLSTEHHVRLILLGFLLHWRDQLPLGGMSEYTLMVTNSLNNSAN